MPRSRPASVDVDVCDLGYMPIANLAAECGSGLAIRETLAIERIAWRANLPPLFEAKIVFCERFFPLKRVATSKKIRRSHILRHAAGRPNLPQPPGLWRPFWVSGNEAHPMFSGKAIYNILILQSNVHQLPSCSYCVKKDDLKWQLSRDDLFHQRI